MSAIKKLSKGLRLLSYVLKEPKAAYDTIFQQQQGEQFSRQFTISESKAAAKKHNIPISRLEEWFNNRIEGNGIWKWRHYFEIYNRHLARFVGKGPSLLEVGIYSGGSLEMWRSYFGDDCTIYGVDIAEECRTYQGPQTQIFIGDQEDRCFWHNFRTRAPNLDVIIDDGGHRPNQKIATLEELLPHMNPGGVYICEDVHGIENYFYQYCCGLTKMLNGMDADNHDLIRANSFQRWVKGVYFYPFIVIIERADNPIDSLVSVKHGNIWRPTL